MMFKKTSLATLRIKGIRAQLFFGFGALVVVINLFYFRMTTLFVDVTEGWVSHYILTSEAQNFAQSGNNSTSKNDVPARENTLDGFLKTDLVIVSDEELNNLVSITPSLFDEDLFRFEYRGSAGYAYKLPVANDYVLLNTKNTPALAYFSSVFGVFLLSAAIGVILLTVLSTWFIAAKLSAPIIALTNKVASQQVERPCEIEESSRQDEIGELAKTFEQTFLALQQAWRREHDFASDVSHELRTPIALIQNTLVLNQQQDGAQTPMSEDDRQLIAMSARTLQNTVEVLLSLARKENLIFESHLLLPFIERTLLSLYGANPNNEFEVDVDVSPKALGIGNGHLITLLFQNLINNGFYHGGKSESHASMRVYSKKMSVPDSEPESAGYAIVFENAVDAFPSTNYQGLGHGQYLVKRIAQVMQWHIEIESSDIAYAVTVYPKQ